MRLTPSLPESLTVDGLVFAIRWSRRRRTIGITVARDGGLRVLAPAGVRARTLETMVRARLPWVRRKIAEFEALGPPPQPKLLEDGERLPYFGRTYRIVLVDAGRGDSGGSEPPVALRRGRFEIARDLDGAARPALIAWYTGRARAHVEAAVATYVPLVGATPASVVVRDLGITRWGVCNGRTRVVSFHWELALHPAPLLDYVVVHELAHLLEPNHGARFWRHVEAVLPDWKARRSLLRQVAHSHMI